MKDFIFIHIPRNGGTSIVKALRPFSSRRSFGSHRSALERIEETGEDEFRASFSFAIVRNPWDRQVSFYEYIRKDSAHHLHRKIKTNDFKTYVKRILLIEPRLMMSSIDYLYSWTGKLLVNFVGKFERLNEDFQMICKELEIVTTLSKLNASVHESYQEYYDEETKGIVREIFKEDIFTFGYEF